MAEFIIDLTGVEVRTAETASDMIAALWGFPVRGKIVRCKDCRYYDEISHVCDHPCVTPLRGDCPENWIFSCFDNDFCAWGKRRSDGRGIA